MRASSFRLPKSTCLPSNHGGPEALRMPAEAKTPSDLFLELLRRFQEEGVEYGSSVAGPFA